MSRRVPIVRGTTLVEIMVAVAFMAVAVSALVGSMWRIHMNQGQSEYRLLGLAVAEDETAIVRRQALAGTLALGVHTRSVNGGGAQGNISVRRTVTPTSTASLYLVLIEADWSVNNERPDHVTLTTYVRM